MTTFSTQAWATNLPLYEKILTMPFNAELAEGTLREDRFRHYIIQDAHYLEGFARALALASAKADTADQIVQFAEAARTAIIVERALHAEYFTRFGVTPADFAAARPTPACDHYVSYLLRVAALDPFPVVLAALLPCFWIYGEVGKSIHARAAEPNPYRAWIDTYAGEEFAAAVQAVIATTDEVAAHSSAETRTAMQAAFTRATQLEWMFWDSAYRLAPWPA
jgi:thiaminase/transcriptional activator TenA